MKPLFIMIIIGAVVAVLAVFLVYRVLKPRYRGAIGFKKPPRFPDRHAESHRFLQGRGVPHACSWRTLIQLLGSAAIPDEVTITWRFVSDTTDRTARVSLASVPKGTKDGELFFVLSDSGTWTGEYAPKLQLENLQRGE
jgi:hypothetical protein